MANRNPSPETRFSADRPGRAKQKGARDRLSVAFLTALSEDFDKNGKDALVKVRAEDPATYIRVVASLQPKELEAARPLDDLSDEDLAILIEAVKVGLLGPIEPKKSKKHATIT